MDRVGSDIRSYRALLEDARAYDDILIVLEAEAEAQMIQSLEAQVKSRG